MQLPSFSWANGAEVWTNSLEKDAQYYKLRNQKMLEKHPTLDPIYRTKLLDWLSLVSHVYSFHRETYHLAIDYVDRYLTAQANVTKDKLQLIGATCLFIAAKYEEIRPPTVNEFAYLTDGGCTADEIVNMEVVILSAIEWEITPMTPNSWLNIYSLVVKFNINSVANVIDLALLHIESLRYSNLTLTAAALYHFTNEKTVKQCTGLKYQELSDCINWLQPFVDCIQGEEQHLTPKPSPHMHNHIQNAEELLDRVVLRKDLVRRSLKRKAAMLEDITDSENDSVLSSPVKQSTVLLTPPSSTRKSRKYMKKA